MSTEIRSAVFAAPAARRPSPAARRATAPRSKVARPASSSRVAFVTASRNQRSCATRMTAASTTRARARAIRCSRRRGGSSARRGAGGRARRRARGPATRGSTRLPRRCAGCGRGRPRRSRGRAAPRSRARASRSRPRARAAPGAREHAASVASPCVAGAIASSRRRSSPSARDEVGERRRGRIRASVRPRSSGGRWSCSATRFPSRTQLAAVEARSPASTRSSVVLPAPLGRRARAGRGARP